MALWNWNGLNCLNPECGDSRSLTKSHEVSLCLQTSLGTSPHHRNANPPWQLGNSGSIEQREQPQIILIKMLNHGKHGKEWLVWQAVENVLCHKTQRMAMAKSSQYSPYLTLLQSFSVLSHLQTSTVQYCPRDLVAPILVDVHIAGVWKVVLICEPSTLFFRAGSSSSPIFNEKREGGSERERESAY